MKHYNPFHRGRYYRVFVETNHSVYKITKCDIPETVLAGNSVKFPKTFHCMEVVCDVCSVVGGEPTTYGTRKIYGDGCQAVELPDVKNFDYLEFYVFGYIKRD